MVKFRGADRTESHVPLYEILSGRKTFITNSLEKGMPLPVIMDITTHKYQRSFKRYLKITDEFKKREMEKVFG